MKKMNLVEKFTAVKALLNGEKVEGFTVADALAFMDNRIEQTEKKNASGNGERKPTKEQIANEGIKEQIVAFLRTQSAPMSISNMQKANATFGAMSNQKVTALVSQLVKAGKVVRTEVKGKAHFAIAE